jgi:hypothetical protein
MRFHLYALTGPETDYPSGTRQGSYDSLAEAKRNTYGRRWEERRGADGRRVWLGLPTADVAWCDQIREEPGSPAGS